MNDMKAGESGFTLMELMIAVAIIGILAAIAYPSYQGYITKSARAAGQSLLTQVANRQEQYFMDNKTYADSLTKLGYSADPLPVNNDGQAGVGGTIVYNIEIDGSTATSYDLHAVPQGRQATQDTDCATLTLDNRGLKDATGANAANCW